MRSAGLLLRNEDNHELAFLEDKDRRRRLQLPSHVPLLRIEETQGHFFINDKFEGNSSDPLCLIVPRKQSGHRLREGDRVRLGKASLQVLRLFWRKSRGRNHYEEISQPKIAERQSVFACSFYSELEKASLVESNPACRFCYSKTIEPANPFLTVCSCSGSAKYIHEQCLVEWIRKRSGVDSGQLQPGVYYACAKAFSCEVCHALYRTDRLIRQVFGAEGSALENYVALQVNSEPALIYVVDTDVLGDVQVGRSLEGTIVINELSVSRRHCLLRADRERKALTIVDLSAKFGTVVEVERGEIEDLEEYQKGRTKLQFRRMRKLSFFERIGFCSQAENLRNERL